MFTVMGITGQVGGAVAENLLAAGKQVRGVVRDLEKAKAWADRGVELVHSVYDDAEGLAKAFTGAEGVFVMLPPDIAPDPELQVQKRIVGAIHEALKQANPGKAVFLSAMGAEQPKGIGLSMTTRLMEEATSSLSIPVAYLRAGIFMDNTLGALEHIRATGEMPTFYAPLDRQLPLVATRDVGLVAARTLQETWTGQRVLEVDGPEGGTSQAQVAAAFSKAMGREVKAIELPEPAWQTVLQGMGLPADRTGLFIETLKATNCGWIRLGNPGTEKFHGSTTIDAFAQNAVG